MVGEKTYVSQVKKSQRVDIIPGNGKAKYCSSYEVTGQQLVIRRHCQKYMGSSKTVPVKLVLLGLKSTTTSSMIYGELGLYPLNIDIKLRMVSYWTRLLHGKDNKLSCLLYKLMLNLSDENNEISKWIKFIQNNSNECCKAFIWMQHNFPSEQWLKMTIKTILQDQYKQTWNSNVFHSPKTINYRIYKTEHVFENYLHILNKKDLYTFLKFRTMNHKLPIEAGRWQNAPREDRLCILCNENMIGD